MEKQKQRKKKKPNQDLRDYIKASGVKFGEVAAELGHRQDRFSQFLNEYLNEEQRFIIVAAVEVIRARKREEANVPTDKS